MREKERERSLLLFAEIGGRRRKKGSTGLHRYSGGYAWLSKIVVCTSETVVRVVCRKRSIRESVLLDHLLGYLERKCGKLRKLLKNPFQILEAVNLP